MNGAAKQPALTSPAQAPRILSFRRWGRVGMATDVSTWRTAAAGELLALRNPDGGWPYQTSFASATEPTALAALALADAAREDNILPAAADWLVARQQADGFFTASRTHEEGSWLTPLAALTLARLGRTEPVVRAAQALLDAQVFTLNQHLPNIYGYDTSLRGWAWSPEAFSFIEPTAWTTLFLKQAGYSGHRRVREAIELIRNRALAAGGWNYGEPEVLGGPLFPTDAPTALVLLALADEPDQATAAGLNWLLNRRGRITSVYSLGWTTIALNVLGALTGAWEDEVVTIWSELPTERRDAVGTALCLLGLRAATGHPLALA